MHPKFSIVTVCKNSEETIRYTLNSVKSQTYKNIEHIIIDGISNDGTIDIINEYINSDPQIPITFISEKDEGIYDAINKGIKNSNGDFISILNADDIFHSNKSVEKIVEYIKNDKKNDIFFFGLTYFKNDNFKKIIRYYPSKNFKKWMLNFGIIPPHPASIIKKKVYDNFGYYDKNFKISGDFDLFLRLLKKNQLSFISFDFNTIKMKTGGASGKNLFSYYVSLKENYISLKKNKEFASLFFLLLKVPSKILQYFLFNQLKINKDFQIFNNIIKYKSFNKKIKIIINLDKIFEKNFVLSGLNLAFLGYYFNKQVKLYKNLYHWPDGIFSKLLNTKKIEKIPGRKLLKEMILPKNIKKIHVLGVLGQKSKLYLEQKYNIDVLSTDLPYAPANKIINYIPKRFDENTLILITLPTPKQEIIAEFIAENQNNYKIICIGASLAMCSGEEKVVPEILDKFSLEFIWRLRSDTRRRIIRLIQTFLYFTKGILSKKNRGIIIEEI
ncbi:MAG: hypothetical protein CBC82_07375 [Cellvibrionales bacterium TMED122]|nr:MAG: hypothetical protein CBC82_07375 [Cellvibrionales bacterium TMED122]|tara:strand:- start:1351 stop:2847 length:1497 start_codon:yes stop_codon:yes gene_type:complete